MAGAETALWDLLGQAHHATIAELLGAIDEQVSLGVQSGLAVGLYPSIVELLKAIETHLGEGYRRVKIKIQPGSDVELVRAVRQHFGEIPLMVDANGAYTAADIEVFRELDDFDLLMFEQPMAADDLDGLAAASEGGRHAGLHRRDGRDATSRPPRRSGGALAGSSTSRSSAWAGWARPGRSMTSATSTASPAGSGRCPSSGIGQAAGIHLGTLANCKYPTDVEPVRPLVRRRLRRAAPGALRAGTVQRPHPARPRIPGRPGQGPTIPGSPDGVHGQVSPSELVQEPRT